jgi:2,3-dihydroxybiphenyl 1,2-dioxygenase
MRLQSLGYVGFRAGDLSEWRAYGTRHLGFQVVDRSSGTVAFRMDDRKQRVVVEADGGKGVKFLGWEVEDAAALDAIAARIEEAGARVQRGQRALAEERRVADLIVLADPLGTRLEIFHGGEVTAEPFRPGRNISGFRTGPLGLGHVVMTAERIDEAVEFYRRVLGFGLSDYYDRPFPARFLHVNGRHHSLAFIQSGIQSAQSGKAAIHHLNVELMSLDDVGQGLDLALAEEGRLAVSLGRHAGDYMTSFYTHTPSGFMVEYGWGGKAIDPDTWVATERSIGPSLWGHERSWLPPEKRAEALALRLRNAEAGERRPVQVMEGNHELTAGVCPWWDSVKKG